jgi:hypothetical protein
MFKERKRKTYDEDGDDGDDGDEGDDGGEEEDEEDEGVGKESTSEQLKSVKPTLRIILHRIILTIAMAKLHARRVHKKTSKRENIRRNVHIDDLRDTDDDENDDERNLMQVEEEEKLKLIDQEGSAEVDDENLKDLNDVEDDEKLDDRQLIVRHQNNGMLHILRQFLILDKNPRSKGIAPPLGTC